VRRCLVLYGPPASGKDTITAELSAAWPQYVPFRRLKSGKGNTTGYRMTTPEDIDALTARGDVLYRNDRYRSTYAVDRAELDALCAAGNVPVVHLGQIDGVQAVTAYPAAWTRVLLWCPRQTTRDRVIARGNTDVEERLGVWDETYVDVAHNPDAEFHRVIHTDVTPAHIAAGIIHQAVTSGVPASPVRDLISIQDNA
jgi:guanylate kinase